MGGNVWNSIKTTEHRMDRTERKRCAHVPRIELGIQLVSVMICLAAFIVVLDKHNGLDKANQMHENPSLRAGLNVCVECLRLLSNPYKLPEQDLVFEIFTKRQENGVLHCCADNLHQMSAMLDAISGNQELDVEAKDHHSVPASAHKMMKPSNVNIPAGLRFNDNFQNVVTFNPKEHLPPKEHVRGIIVLEDGMLVVDTGYYFLYCSVSYRPAGNQTSENLISYVHRTRPNSVNGTDVLLQFVHTSCQKCKTTELEYTGGVFLLIAGDFIQVMLSGNDLINFYTESSYLGLVMLGYG